LDAVKPNYFILSHSKGAKAIKNIQSRYPTPISLLFFMNHRIKMLFFLVFLRVKIRFKNIFSIKKLNLYFFVILTW